MKHLIIYLSSVLLLGVGISFGQDYTKVTNKKSERYIPTHQEKLLIGKIYHLVEDGDCRSLLETNSIIEERWLDNFLELRKHPQDPITNKKDYFIGYIHDSILAKCEKNLYHGRKVTNMDLINIFPLPSTLPNTGKPVIYLYPHQTTQVDVELETAGSVFFTYPEYDNGWSVIAQPDGTLYDSNDNEYSYLFRDGHDTHDYYDLTEGFVIHRDDVVMFLQDSLSQQGLIPTEYNEFIVYRAPLMLSHPEEYFLIRFADEQEYDLRNPLTITPTPDTLERIYMVFLPLQEKIQVDKQALTGFERDGFTVVEWGGTDLSTVAKHK